MINFENVSKIFKPEAFAPPFQALDDVSMQVKPGSITGFLGANGAGKSTSMKIIMDFIRPSKGRVLFDKSLGNTQNEIFSQIGFLPERPFFYPNLKGREFLFYMGSLANIKKQGITDAVNKWAPIFKIDFALDRKIGTYSKGMLQRIGFMATLIHEPEFIILDEPLSGLDPIGRKDLKDVILEVHKEGKTVFFSSHIVGDVEEVCDEIVFLKSGKLEFSGTVSDLLEKNQSQKSIISFRGDIANCESVELLTHKKNGISEATIDSSNKNSFIHKLIDANADIVSVEAQRMTLEEIFYKVKNE